MKFNMRPRLLKPHAHMFSHQNVRMTLTISIGVCLTQPHWDNRKSKALLGLQAAVCQRECDHMADPEGVQR